MFNNVRRCLVASVRIRGKFLVRSVREDISPVFYSCTNAGCSSDAVYKRFYCNSTPDEQNLTSMDLRNRQRELEKQKLSEFLSVPENKKHFEILQLEIDMLRHNAERVPDNIEEKDWLALLTVMGKAKRKKYFEFLWRNERTAEHLKAKKEAKRAEWLAKKQAEEAENPDGIKYGLNNNSLFMRIYETTMNNFYNNQLILNMMFESKIVFDCSYESNMSTREIHNCAKQMVLAFANNRTHSNPMDLYFCNFNKDGLLKQHLHQNIPTLLNDDFPVTVTSQSYLDIFPKNQLVYLTPDSKINLNEYDPNMVYIIGALIDRGKSLPLSMAKAKREGIHMVKFPIDRYLDWGFSSSKSLTLDQSLRIMLDLRCTKDWKEALKNVPTRKLKPAREHLLRNKLQKSIAFDISETQELEKQRPISFDRSETREPKEQRPMSFDRSKTRESEEQRPISFDRSETRESEEQRPISFDRSETREPKVQRSMSFDRSKTREFKMPLNFTFQKRKMS